MVAGERTVAVRGFARLHGGRAAGKLLEDSNVPILVVDVVTLEDDPTLVFTVRVSFLKLAALKYADVEDATDVNIEPALPSFPTHIVPLPDLGLVPTSAFFAVGMLFVA